MVVINTVIPWGTFRQGGTRGQRASLEVSSTGNSLCLLSQVMPVMSKEKRNNSPLQTLCTASGAPETGGRRVLKEINKWRLTEF